MIFQLHNLDSTTVRFLPQECQECGWWQGHPEGWESEDRHRTWMRQAEEVLGGWGKLVLMDDRLLGMIQYGPPPLFRGVRQLPCSPPSRDSILLTCSIIVDGSFAAARGSLLLAAIAELKDLEVEAVEAFSYQEVSPDRPGHLLDRDLLQDSGFYPARSAGGIQLMRMEMGGIERSSAREIRRRSRISLLDRIKRPSPAPSPAAMCSDFSGGRSPMPTGKPLQKPANASEVCG